MKKYVTHGTKSYVILPEQNIQRILGGNCEMSACLYIIWLTVCVFVHIGA